MGVTNDGFAFPVPTGAVEPPPGEVVFSQVGVNEPTGAVESEPDKVTTEFGPSGQQPAGNVEIPKVQTFENVSVKVLNAPKQEAAEGDSTAETESRRTRQSGSGGN